MTVFWTVFCAAQGWAWGMLGGYLLWGRKRGAVQAQEEQ